jgi:hypothetical protein
VLFERGEQLELVAAEPHRHAPAFQVDSAFDAGRLECNLAHAAVSEHLGDVDQRRTLVTGGEKARQPVDSELSAATSHHLFGHDVRTAGTDGHVELFRLVEALGFRGVVPRELGLGDPLELERDPVGGLTQTVVGHHGDRQQHGHNRHQEPSLQHGAV